MGCYRHLTPEDREEIAAMRAAGHRNSAIAAALGRSPSTISRELRRNALDSGRYSSRVADGAYMARRQRPARLERDGRPATFVRQRLSEGWSPQQIAGWLRTGAEPGLGAVTMETIYSFIYRTSQKAEELWRFLARRRRKRRPMHSRPARDIINRYSSRPSPAPARQRENSGQALIWRRGCGCRCRASRSPCPPDVRRRRR